jgi:hypothetical protein
MMKKGLGRALWILRQVVLSRGPRQGTNVFYNGGFVGWGKLHFGDMPPFGVDAVRVGGDGFFGGKAFNFQDIPVRKKFCVTAPIWVGGILLVGDPFGEKEISQLITDPTFGMAEADFESFGIFLLRESPQISAEVDAGVC